MGQRGCGKSYLGRNIQTCWPRRIIIDTLGEYSDQDGTVVFTFDEFSDFLTQRKSDGSDFVLIYQFDPESQLSDLEFDEIVRVAFYFGNCQLVIEEIQEHSTPHSMPHWLKKALLTGRHQNLSLLFTSQRPGEINKTIISQCSHIFVGKIVEGNDLKYIAYFLGDKAQELTTLPDRVFLYRDRSGSVTKVSNDF